MSEDAHEIAQRIVREVLDAHDEAVARTADDDGSLDTPADGDGGIDLQDAPPAVAPDASAALLDDSTARLTARRIVAEVLASHADADRDISGELPVVAEGEAPGPSSATPVLHPITGRPAVLPSLPDEPDPDADLADDAAAIARRIVASVLNQRPPASDEGPPPLPHHRHTPPEDTSETGEFAESAGESAEPSEAAAVAPAPEPIVVHGSHRLAPRTPAEPAVDDGAPTALRAAVPVEAEPTSEAEPAPESTAVLPPDEPTDHDATMRVPVATLERPAADEATVDPTLSLPSAEPPRRTGRWLLASILGAVALAVLLPLAVEALRTLVSLS